jgi:hypothetical protein
MTRVGIATSPAFRAGFLICVEKGFMVLSCLMRQQRAEARCWLASLPDVGYAALDRFLMLKPTVVRFWRAETTKLVGPSSSSRTIAAIAWRLRL